MLGLLARDELFKPGLQVKGPMRDDVAVFQDGSSVHLRSKPMPQVVMNPMRMMRRQGPYGEVATLNSFSEAFPELDALLNETQD